MKCYGKFPANYWSLTDRLSTYSNQVIYEQILQGAKHSIGTVRLAAFQSFGEILLNHGWLHVDVARQDITWSCSAGSIATSWKFTDLMQCLQSGCQDTKLAVSRYQH